MHADTAHSTNWHRKEDVGRKMPLFKHEWPQRSLPISSVQKTFFCFASKHKNKIKKHSVSPFVRTSYRHPTNARPKQYNWEFSTLHLQKVDSRVDIPSLPFVTYHIAITRRTQPTGRCKSLSEGERASYRTNKKCISPTVPGCMYTLVGGMRT